MYVDGRSCDIVVKDFNRSNQVEFYAAKKVIGKLENTRDLFAEGVLPINYIIEGLKITINKRLNRDKEFETCILIAGKPLESYVFTSGGIGKS